TCRDRCRRPLAVSLAQGVMTAPRRARAASRRCCPLRGLPMRHAWLFLAGFLIALLIARPAAAHISSVIGDRSFNVAEAYPGTAGSYGAESGIADPQLFAGRCPGTPLACAVPGVLCLQR